MFKNKHHSYGTKLLIELEDRLNEDKMTKKISNVSISQKASGNRQFRLPFD
ncbi:Uncharacterised protein [Sphingobacterium thalpophilum]|uniref:Uncharacterized protein n=1 Tax=Sphingobacterium thalpophilum TaxID=259 RepID=A0A4U9VPQ0_9SPHI|nr:Uncharacterised protein [Sphingobacterium thalpophilum]